MIAPFYTKDERQAARCQKTVASGSIITEVFGTIAVAGRVQSAVDHRDAQPRSWSITFDSAATRAP